MSQKNKIVKWTGNRQKLARCRKTSTRTEASRKFVIRKHSHGGIVKLINKSKDMDENSKKSTENSVLEKTISEPRAHYNVSEKDRMAAKLLKVKNYWNGSSLMIPNVFRIFTMFDDCNDFVLEYQDLSQKEVLALNGGFKMRNELSEDS